MHVLHEHAANLLATSLGPYKTGVLASLFEDLVQYPESAHHLAQELLHLLRNFTFANDTSDESDPSNPQQGEPDHA